MSAHHQVYPLTSLSYRLDHLTLVNRILANTRKGNTRPMSQAAKGVSK